MDFNDSTEEAAYREKARAWLAENAAAHRAKWGELKPNTPEHMAAAKEWQATKASAGYACIMAGHADGLVGFFAGHGNGAGSRRPGGRGGEVSRSADRGVDAFKRARV